MTNVQFITHFTDKISYETSAALALQGGCRWIQLRMKDAEESEIVGAARRVRALCDEVGAKLIIDDHVELVVETGADGVHLGKNDMPIRQARQLLGNGYVIGGTANTFEDVKRIYEEGADYVGCGPFRFTTTKKNLASILGTEGYADILLRMKAEDIKIPLIAIGGITCDDIPALKKIGISGIAISGSILRAADPIAEMKRIVSMQESL
ncbi:MAG: thiamine phosphate synthase [Bacteroidaceae bacterium]|nr:thiamine phosphate synthase [Bacteroidaceae bacterium]